MVTGVIWCPSPGVTWPVWYTCLWLYPHCHMRARPNFVPDICWSSVTVITGLRLISLFVLADWLLLVCIWVYCLSLTKLTPAWHWGYYILLLIRNVWQHNMKHCTIIAAAINHWQITKSWIWLFSCLIVLLVLLSDCFETVGPLVLHCFLCWRPEPELPAVISLAFDRTVIAPSYRADLNMRLSGQASRLTSPSNPSTKTVWDKGFRQCNSCSISSP